MPLLWVWAALQVGDTHVRPLFRVRRAIRTRAGTVARRRPRQSRTHPRLTLTGYLLLQTFTSITRSQQTAIWTVVAALGLSPSIGCPRDSGRAGSSWVKGSTFSGRTGSRTRNRPGPNGRSRPGASAARAAAPRRGVHVPRFPQRLDGGVHLGGRLVDAALRAAVADLRAHRIGLLSGPRHLCRGRAAAPLHPHRRRHRRPLRPPASADGIAGAQMVCALSS